MFQAYAAEVHRPTACAVCGQPLADDASSTVYTAFQSLDLTWGDPAVPGLHLWVVAHQYQVVTCPCGHHTRAQPGMGAGDPTLAGVQVREWRLGGRWGWPH